MDSFHLLIKKNVGCEEITFHAKMTVTALSSVYTGVCIFNHRNIVIFMNHHISLDSEGCFSVLDPELIIVSVE